MSRSPEGRGASVHITISILRQDELRSKVAAHLHAIPHARTLVVFCDRATRDAKRLAAHHNWRTWQDEALIIIIRESGM